MTSLHVFILARNTRFDVPYMPDMLACDYLRDVLVPLAGLRMDRNKVSVLDRVRYVTPDKIVTFNFENRLRKLCELVPADATLIVLPLFRDLQLFGNATRANVYADCTICLEANTNFSLQCTHRFHDSCLCHWRPSTCPVCRAPFSSEDMEKLQLSVIEGVREGRIAKLPASM